MSGVKIASVMTLALALAGCDVVLERERHGARTKQTSERLLPPGSVPRGQGELTETAARAPIVDLALMRRGRERYAIFCTPCHGPTGYGDGPVVQRGYPKAAPFHTDRLRSAPLSHIVAVVTEGIGAMPSYAERIPPADRWAIASFVKALQLAEHFPADRLDFDREGATQ